MSAAAAHARAAGVEAPPVRSAEEETDNIIDRQIAAAKAKASPKKEAKKENPRAGTRRASTRSPKKQGCKAAAKEKIHTYSAAYRELQAFRRRLHHFGVENPEDFSPTPPPPVDEKAKRRALRKALREQEERAAREADNKDKSLEEKLRRQEAREQEAAKFAEALAIHEEYENMVDKATKIPPIWNTLLPQEGGGELIDTYTNKTTHLRKMSWSASTWPPLPNTAEPAAPLDPEKERERARAEAKAKADAEIAAEKARQRAEERAKLRRRSSIFGALSPTRG